jgi:hypothetical protein
MGINVMPRPKRDDIAVKIAAPLYRKAKVIAAHRGVTIAEYLSSLLDKPLERDYQKFRREVAGEQPPDLD